MSRLEEEYKKIRGAFIEDVNKTPELTVEAKEEMPPEPQIETTPLEPKTSEADMAIQPLEEDNNPQREPLEEETKEVIKQAVTGLQDTDKAYIKNQVGAGVISPTQYMEQPSAGNIVASQLAGELGSDASGFQAEGKSDIRRFGRSKMQCIFAKSYMRMRGVRVPIYREFIENLDNYEVGVDGWRTVKAIDMQGAASGQTVKKEPEKPNIFSRNITNRGWKEKAETE